MRLFSIALAVFGLVALYTGVSRGDAMTLGFGGASLLAAALIFSPLQSSSFFDILNGLFVVETITFGLINLADLGGFWPEVFADYVPPRYLPLATALFIPVLYAISQFPFVRRMMKIADPFFDASTPAAFHIRPFAPFTMTMGNYARLCVVLLVIINQGQVAISVWNNFFSNQFGNAIQVPDEEHRVAFWHLLLTVFPLIAGSAILSNLIEYAIASNFTLQWRRWMTASYTARWLTNSMHYRMALAGSTADNPDQRISQDVGAFINGTGLGSLPGGTGSVGFYNYTLSAIQTATNLVSFSIILWTISRTMNMTLGGVAVPGLLFWVAIAYALLATGLIHLIGRQLAGLLFRQQTVEANFRFDLARAREFGEQIALLRGEPQEIKRAGSVFQTVFMTLKRIILIRLRLIAFNSLYGQISGLIPYFVIAPFYYAKQVTFGVFNQAADAFGSVNGAMNFFVNNYIGFADFRSTVDRLTSFDEAFARVDADRASDKGVHVTMGADATLSMPGLALKLPNGQNLLGADGLVLVPQESTVVVGLSGSGKSTLFRAIAGLWPYGSGEIKQPDHASLMLLPQRPYLPMGSLRDAVAYPRAGGDIDDAILRDALTTVGLPAFASRLDESDNWQMRLSGGEQQRIGVARALIAKPDWLFLDESTASLDEQSEAGLYGALAKALPGTTLVSIGHRSTLAAFHKRRIEVKKGADGVAVVS